MNRNWLLKRFYAFPLVLGIERVIWYNSFESAYIFTNRTIEYWTETDTARLSGLSVSII